jgi:hypothetical protein
MEAVELAVQEGRRWIAARQDAERRQDEVS